MGLHVGRDTLVQIMKPNKNLSWIALLSLASTACLQGQSAGAMPLPMVVERDPLHEPTHPRPLPGGEQASVRVLSFPLLGGVRGGFMVPMQAPKRMEAFHEPWHCRTLAVVADLSAARPNLRKRCGLDLGIGHFKNPKPTNGMVAQ